MASTQWFYSLVSETSPRSLPPKIFDPSTASLISNGCQKAVADTIVKCAMRAGAFGL